MGGPPPPPPPQVPFVQIPSEIGKNATSLSHPPRFTPPGPSARVPRLTGMGEDALAYVQMLEQQQEQTSADIAILKMEIARMKVKDRPTASHSDSQGRRQRRGGPPPPPIGNAEHRYISVHDQLDPPMTDNRAGDSACFRQQRSPVHQCLGGGRHEGSPHIIYLGSSFGDEYSQRSQNYDTVELQDNHQAIIPYEMGGRKGRMSRRNGKDLEGYPPEHEDIPQEIANPGRTTDSRNARQIPRERSVRVVVRHDD